MYAIAKVGIQIRFCKIHLKSSCARSGLVAAAALFIVFIACKLGRFGCAAGVASAAAVVVVLVVVWAWSEQPAASEEGRPSLPDDAHECGCQDVCVSS